MRPPRLADDRPERPDRLGVVRPRLDELRAAQDDRQRVVQLVGGPGGELGEGLQPLDGARLGVGRPLLLVQLGKIVQPAGLPPSVAGQRGPRPAGGLDRA